MDWAEDETAVEKETTMYVILAKVPRIGGTFELFLAESKKLLNQEQVHPHSQANNEASFNQNALPAAS